MSEINNKKNGVLNIRISLLVLLFLFCSLNAFSQIRINEWMQSNVDCVMDELYEFPDSWIELYNEGEEPINVSGWYIGAKKDFQKCWKLNVDTLIFAKGYLLIYCDKEEKGLHTDFRLETTKKSSLYLFDQSGQLIDQVEHISAQPAPNISMGKNDKGESVCFIQSTPYTKNSTLTASEVTPSPVFSVRAGIYKKPITITLSDTSRIPGAKIYYTTNNSEPNRSSQVYAAPIAIDSTTIIRAKLIADGYLEPRSVVNPYILSDRELTLPIVSIATDDRYLWDDSIGIYCVGTNGRQYGNIIKANFIWKWRRPMVFSYFPNGDAGYVLNQLGEMRIAGDGSRLYPSKSMMIYSHKRFGKSEYSYPFFQNPDKKDAIMKSLMLRNSGQDFLWTYLNDAANQSFMGGKVDLDYQAYQPAILYLNEQYWGIINVRERSTEDYVYGNYNRLEDADVIENWSEVKAGDDKVSTYLLEGLAKNQFSYEDLKGLVDLSEFMNFCILHMYVANRDYPINNVVMWRERKEGSKWRFVVKDTDIGGQYNVTSPQFNGLDYLLHPEKGGGLIEGWDWTKQSALFRTLMQAEAFRSEFVRRFTVYLGDILSEKATHMVVDSLKRQIEEEIPFHLTTHANKALNDNFAPPSLSVWKNEIEKKKQWLSERNRYQYQHLNDYMEYKGLIRLTVEGIPTELIKPIIRMNGIDLQTGSFDGMYYKGQPFTLDCTGDRSQSISWKVTTVYEDREDPAINPFDAPLIEITVNESVKSIQIVPSFTTTGIDVDGFPNFKICRQANGIQLSGLDQDSSVQVFDLSGRLLSSQMKTGYELFIPLSTKGAYIIEVRNGKQLKVQKIIF